MAWIESHEDIGDHYKTQKLMRQLNVSCPTAVGLLHLIFHYTVKVSWEFGDLSMHSTKAIARACWWEGDPDLLWKAFHDSGYMESGKIHEWEVYARELIYQRKYSKRRRQTAEKQLKKSCLTAESFLVAKGSPNQTKPNHTYCPFDFEVIYDQFPSKVGKKQAEKHFSASVKTSEDYDAIQVALKNYLNSDRVRRGFVQNASTWFNNWRDWVDQKPVEVVRNGYGKVV